jgi:BrnA antitoxin of type II toxin-antitoxin system
LSDNPEVTPKMFAKAIVRRGLVAAPPKEQVTLRLDVDVLQWFKSKGKVTRRRSTRFCAHTWKPAVTSSASSSRKRRSLGRCLSARRDEQTRRLHPHRHPPAGSIASISIPAKRGLEDAQSARGDDERARFERGGHSATRLRSCRKEVAARGRSGRCGIVRFVTNRDRVYVWTYACESNNCRRAPREQRICQAVK